MKDERRSRSTAPTAGSSRTHAPGIGKRIDDNLMVVAADGAEVVACAHCGQELGDPTTDSSLNVASFEGPTSLAGSHVTGTPEDYVDDKIVFRQLSCPGCFTAAYTGVVSSAHTDHVLDIDRYASV